MFEFPSLNILLKNNNNKLIVISFLAIKEVNFHKKNTRILKVNKIIRLVFY